MLSVCLEGLGAGEDSACITGDFRHNLPRPTGYTILYPDWKEGVYSCDTGVYSKSHALTILSLIFGHQFIFNLGCMEIIRMDKNYLVECLR